jgi:Fe2+ transport system protein B
MKFGGLLKALAPTIGNAVGGPMGGMALKMVASKLGVPEASIEKVEQILEDEPEKVSLVKEAEKEFADKIRELEINLESFKVETEDRQDARLTFSNDITSKIFAIISLVGFIGYIFMVTLMPPDSNDNAIINLIIGYLGGLVSGISAFFFGSNQNSK